MNTGISDELEVGEAGTVPYLTLSGEPADRYSEYLLKSHRAADGLRNPRNLFDDSNQLDRKWFKRTKDFLNGLNKQSV